MRMLRTAVNPFSTAVSRWWCHSSLRAVAGGKRPDFYRRRRRPPGPPPGLDPALRQARIDAIEQIISADRD
jgi:hypothetical protein